MKTIFPILLMLSVLMATIGSAKGQEIKVMKSALSGARFYQNDVVVSARKVKQQLKDIPLAMKTFKRGRATMGISNVIAGAGGYLIGEAIGVAITGGDPKWEQASLGVGLCLISLPIYWSGANTTIRAVKRYNKVNGYSETSPVMDLEFGSAGNGIGLVLRF